MYRELADRLEDISFDFFNGDLELGETIDALDDLSIDCESSIDIIIDNTEIGLLAALLEDITSFEESLIDACTIDIDEMSQSYEDEYGNVIYEEPSILEAENSNIEDSYIESIDGDSNNFASDKEYEQMRKQWINKRENERKAAKKTEKEIPLEERYKAAMTSFKELQGDESQKWKLEDESKWLVEDLDRWFEEALNWGDIFANYYDKLAKEIGKIANKIEKDYNVPVTEEDINIEDQITNSDEEVSEDELLDMEVDSEERQNKQQEERQQDEAQTEQNSEETTEVQEQSAQEESAETVKETKKEAETESE